MKKKIAILFVILAICLCFAGCEKKYTPDPAVEQFLNTGLTAKAAYDKIGKASYVTTITVLDDDTETGTNVVEVQFDKTDKDNLYYSIHQTYTGIYVSDNVVEMTATLQKSDGKYVYTVVSHLSNKDYPTTKSENVDEQFAIDLITALVYVENGVFYEGGLYYGDYFMQRIYRYPAKSFYVDEQLNLCVFQEKMWFETSDLGQVLLNQTIKINPIGLIEYFYEKYESVDKGTVMISETVPTYEYVDTQD